jgi:hypothetical protein
MKYIQNTIKYLNLLLFLSFFIFIPQSQANNEWENITPPSTAGYSFQVATAIDDSVFLGTDHGVYRSNNSGVDWTLINSGLTDQNIQDIAIQWVFEEIDTDIFSYETNVFTPVFIGTANGFFKGILGGSSWTASNTGLSSLNIKDIEIDQWGFSSLYVATADGVFRSDDSGVSWTLKNSGMVGKSVIKVVSDFGGEKIYALTDSNDLYRSDLFSVSGLDEEWSLVENASSGGTMKDISVMNARGGDVFLTETTGVRKLNYYEQEWTSQNQGLTSLVVNSVATDYTETNIAYIALDNGGVSRMTSEFDGIWEPINVNLSESRAKQVITNPNTSGIVYMVGEGGFYRILLDDPYGDIVSPRSTVTFSSSTAREGDILTIEALFDEPLIENPIALLSLSGANSLSSVEMNMLTSTHYSYTHTVSSGTGSLEVSLFGAQEVEGENQIREVFAGSSSILTYKGDVNRDRVVNIFDFNILLSHFGKSECNNIGDVNKDCLVNIFDFNIFLQDFGKSI